MLCKGQGAFEYVLLLAGMILISVIAILILRSSLLPTASSQLINNTNQFHNAVCFTKTYQNLPSIVSGIWNLNDGSGSTTLKDSSSNGHTGTLGNSTPGTSPAWVTGCPKYGGNCLLFNGVNDSANFSSLSVNSTAGYYNTVEFWMNWTGGGSWPIAFTWTGSGGYNVGISGGNLCISTGNGDTICGGAVPSNQWVFVAAAFFNGVPNTNNVQIYINGVQQALTLSGSPISQTAGASPIIGEYASGSHPFPGELEGLVIYNTSLTSQQVYDDYNCYLGT